MLSVLSYAICPALLGMDIAVTLIALAWVPYWQDSKGGIKPA